MTLPRMSGDCKQLHTALALDQTGQTGHMDSDSTGEIELKDNHLEVVAAERERIAGELHDDSVQVMTSVSLQLQRLANRLGDADPEIIELLGTTRRTTDAAIDRLRHMLFVLHPVSLEDDGLAVALEVYLESYVEPAGIEWEVVDHLSDAQSSALPLGVTALGFRLGREAVANSVRHGGPSSISVVLDLDEVGLLVSITDDGVGFDRSQLRQRAGHLGISHCERLAEAALGSYRVTSAPGSGTRVDIRLPVTEPL